MHLKTHPSSSSTAHIFTDDRNGRSDMEAASLGMTFVLQKPPESGNEFKAHPLAILRTADMSVNAVCLGTKISSCDGSGAGRPQHAFHASQVCPNNRKNWRGIVHVSSIFRRTVLPLLVVVLAADRELSFHSISITQA